MRVLDLCSGIGGFSYVFRPICKTVAYCDIDPHSRIVIKNLIKRGKLDDAPIFDDLRTLDVTRIAALQPDMITAGFPCQDISCMNSRGSGILGPKSKLFFDICDLAEQLSMVNCIMFENSSCIVTRGLDIALERIKKAGFKTIVWSLFQATEVGAWHRRKRWVCICFRTFKRNIPLLPILTYDAWSKTKEPCPRIVACFKNMRHQARLLGNSIVPQCITFAYNTLVKAAIPNKTLHVETHENARPRVFLNLQFNLDGRYVTKTLFATPTGNIQHSTLSNKSISKLSCQLYAERNTIIPKTHCIGINPRFYEFLMGYPLGWCNF